jgi:hypothetical protein
VEVDRMSYCLGMNFAFSEVVGSGVKPLALSPPLERHEAQVLLAASRGIADEFGILLEVEEDCLTTRLFDPAFTAGKTTFLMAADQGILDAYTELKSEAGSARAQGTTQTEEEDIARRFGRLLGYSDAAVESLLRTPRFTGDSGDITRKR